MHDRQRYVVRSVDITKAAGVEESELLKMTIPEPRVRKANVDLAKKASDNKSEKSNAKPRPQKKRKKPKKAKSESASLKTGYRNSFATSTQTLGSIQGCLRRALISAGTSGRIPRLSNDEIKSIADRIQATVFTITEARMYVCRLLDIMIYDALLRDSTTDAASAGLVETFDVLDLLLGKSSGMAIIKYLFSLVLNGKIDNRGPKAAKESTLAAKRAAEATFKRLRDIVPSFEAINKDQTPLGRIIVDAAMEFSVQLRKHFRDIPFTLGKRVSLSHFSSSLYIYSFAPLVLAPFVYLYQCCV